LIIFKLQKPLAGRMNIISMERWIQKEKLFYSLGNSALNQSKHFALFRHG
jgi:hypothetical protein